MRDPYVAQLNDLLSAISNTENARSMKKYLKGKFDFFGIKAPLLRETIKPLLQKDHLPSINQVPQTLDILWRMPQREFQYVGIELLKKYFRKAPKDWIDLYEQLITQKSWWDTVDALASWFVGDYFHQFPNQIKPTTSKWMQSENIWLQRTCLLFQLKYKQNTDFDMLVSFVTPLSCSNEFFIQKAIGWALREHSKLYPEPVKQFVQNHKLAPLSRHEAMRIVQKS